MPGRLYIVASTNGAEERAGVEKTALKENLWKEGVKECAERGRIEPYIIACDRGRTARPSRRHPLALLAYRYFGTRVWLRLTTARGTHTDPFHSFSLVPDEFVVLDKKPPMARTRNAKSARDVSIDSVTADL